MHEEKRISTKLFFSDVETKLQAISEDVTDVYTVELVKAYLTAQHLLSWLNSNYGIEKRDIDRAPFTEAGTKDELTEYTKSVVSHIRNVIPYEFSIRMPIEIIANITEPFGYGYYDLLLYDRLYDQITRRDREQMRNYEDTVKYFLRLPDYETTSETVLKMEKAIETLTKKNNTVRIKKSFICIK